jgi:hypothetical protein
MVGPNRFSMGLRKDSLMVPAGAEDADGCPEPTLDGASKGLADGSAKGPVDGVTGGSYDADG